MRPIRKWLDKCASRRFVLLAFEGPAMAAILVAALFLRGILP
jgi:hypothetical protein